MKKAKLFFVSCLFVSIVFGFPVIGSSVPPTGVPGPVQSKYVIGGVHSNQDVSGSDLGANKNYYIEGDVTAVGTASLGNIHTTSIQSGAPPIHIPQMDFAALQNLDGQYIDAPPVWGAGATNQVIYIDGDVYIDMEDCAAYQNKTIVASGNIFVYRNPTIPSTTMLNANLVARGSIDMDLHGVGATGYILTGLVFAGGEQSVWIGRDGKGDFTGINIDLHSGGHAEKSIKGVVMAKNGEIAVDIHCGGPSDKGIEYADVITDDFNKITTCWREIRG